MNITFDNREEVLKQLPKVSAVKFAVYAARLVSHLNNDPEAEAAIQAAERWIEDPSEENKVAAYHAAYAAAHTAAYMNDATSAAESAATCAAYVAYYSESAGYTAEYAVLASENEEETKQKLVLYLKQLYLENLPEDERDCWLVQAAIGV